MMSDASCFVLLAEETLQTKEEGLGSEARGSYREVVARPVTAKTSRVFEQPPRRLGWRLAQVM